MDKAESDNKTSNILLGSKASGAREREKGERKRERETRMLNAMNQQRGNTEIKQTAHFNDGMELFEWM